MSYDVWLTIDTGGAEFASVGDDFNMTSNISPMWRLAGADVAEFDGKRAGGLVAILDAAIGKMEVDPTPYRALNAPNGWGTYDDCLRFLRGMRDEFVRHPRTTVRVSR